MLLSKVPSKKLSKALKRIIGDCQQVFMEGRQITDAIMIANEVLDDLVRSKGSRILCKLDMVKAFDYVCWDFVD